jgi:hypothetical protein
VISVTGCGGYSGNHIEATIPLLLINAPLSPPTPGKLMLRESAMCPDADKASFEDIALHRYFNTNNLWVNLPALKATLDASGGVMALPLIKNKKTVNPRDAASAAVFQLETAMGSAIECFEGAGAVVVPRTRFAPVKTTRWALGGACRFVKERPATRSQTL